MSLRTSLGLKATDSTKVNLIIDNVICGKVATGINTAQKTPGVMRRLYVVKVDNYAFAAVDPDRPSGEWRPTVTLDSHFLVKGLVLAP